MDSGSMAVRLLLVGFLVCAIGACSDPGSGGTGVPGTGNSPPPETGGDMGAPVAGVLCSAPAGATSEVFTGEIRSLANDCLVVGERSIRIDSAPIARRSGASASRDDLIAGTRVSVEPLPEDPSRARRITIEDLPE